MIRSLALWIALIVCLCFNLLVSSACSTNNVIEVDFLQSADLTTNVLGPHVIKFDEPNNRIIVAGVNSSAVGIIEGKTYAVETIPLASRLPRRFHLLSVAVHQRTGKIYLAADHKLVIVNPRAGMSRTIALKADYETVAVDQRNETAVLVARQSGELAKVTSADSQAYYLKWGEPLAQLPWKAATPPPPIRTVFTNSHTNEIYIVDGSQPAIVVINALTLQILRRRLLPVPAYPRWHLAGFDSLNSWIYFVLEDENRVARQVLRISASGTADEVVELPPQSREPQGVSAALHRQEVYIPYDNHPYIHVVGFNALAPIDSIPVPKFGMDASVVDAQNNRLLVTNWAEATLYLIDLEQRQLIYTVPHFPIYPHTNHLAFNSTTGDLFVPSGATVVNGTFGASLTLFNVNRNEFKRILTGWGPVSLAACPNSDDYFVFSSDQPFARVKPDGRVSWHELPYAYAHEACFSEFEKWTYVAFGPHSSMWPSFYIGATRNGIFALNEHSEVVSTIITDRLAQKIIFDNQGNLWALQNTWGNEKPFVACFPREKRRWRRIFLPDQVENECAFRLLAADPELPQIYIGRTGNLSHERGRLFIVHQETFEIKATVPLGITPTGISIRPQTNQIFISNFDSDSVSVIERTNFKSKMIACGHKPLAIQTNSTTGTTFVVNHLGRSLSVLGKKNGQILLPADALPNNFLVDSARNLVYVTAHNSGEFRVYQIEPVDKKVTTVFKKRFPYGDVSFDQSTTAFSVRGQWADAIFKITALELDKNDRLWITDFLAGKLWILER